MMQLFFFAASVGSMDWKQIRRCSGSDGEALCRDGQHTNEPPSHH